MTEIARTERTTQNRVIELFTGLGYSYLGNWSKRANNRPIEAELLAANLTERGYSSSQVSQAIDKLQRAAEIRDASLYNANRRTYELLRYGVKVQTSVSEPNETVHLIDWETPDANDFAIAEEVTLKGDYERRPDLVIYLNGIAVAVIELKRSSVDVVDGIRQLVTNQEPQFHAGFFSTVQLVAAGNDSQGLRYGTVGTPEQFFTSWKDDQSHSLDRPLAYLFQHERLLDFLRHCILFDKGIKKVPRPHQYHGFKAAQERIARREGGVIWHTQGSGKSILMVMLAKWLCEHDPHARILIVTDRDELDKQIEGVLHNMGVTPKRITSRHDFVHHLAHGTERVLCALLHKFDVADLQGDPPKVSGQFYVLVDECHRTQGGDMHRQMKRWLHTALFLGFTGTPLLRQEKETTRDVFGTYIHTYKFHQAVADGVVLDLKYEARDVPQHITSGADLDKWFDQSTKGLNTTQKAILRQRWATMQELMSSGERKERIVRDIVKDFYTRTRLSNDCGTAILVTSSIYDACHYFRLFQDTPFGGYCGLVTSYTPQPSIISTEPPGGDERYKFDTYTKYVLQGRDTAEVYEKEIKRRFIEEPANTKLLIVVSKLLTGFDAPSCTCIYLDHELRDHNLFQAICRTNRLDGDSKDYGYIIDYKESLGHVQEMIAVYNSDALDTDAGSGGDNNIHLKDYLQESRKQLDEARKAVQYLCESVSPPCGIEQYLAYFCGDAADHTALAEKEPLRVAYYKLVARLLRTFAELSSRLTEAGYSDAEAAAITHDVTLHTHMRNTIKRCAGEELDTKPYEADMRYLINTYIEADAVAPLGDLDGKSLTELIVQTGIHDVIASRLNVPHQLSEEAVADTITNNLRQTIIKNTLTDPRFYAEMSRLLDNLIRKRRDKTLEYAGFLRESESLAMKITGKQHRDGTPETLRHNHAAAALYSNLRTIPAASFVAPADDAERTDLALRLDAAIRNAAPAHWRGDDVRVGEVGNAIFPLLQNDHTATLELLAIIKQQPEY